jgi:ABC-2 type transport system ATP-binding protein
LLRDDQVLEAIGLTKRYEDGLLALDHLDLAVPGGEIFCLLGANGAGKTTTINLFLNLLEPTEGTARICGHDVVREPLSARGQVSFVSENVRLYGAFTARQNLEFFSRLGGRRGLTRGEYQAIMERVGLERTAHDMRVSEFSKGMLQKLGIAIALTKNAPVVLLDEPTSGLDPKAAREFIDLLEELRDEGKTIFMSTHDIFRAKSVANRIGIMRKGKLMTIMDRQEFLDTDLEGIYLQFMAAE